jgi:hypothetical protein
MTIERYHKLGRGGMMMEHAYAVPTIEHRGGVAAVTLGGKNPGTLESSGTLIGITTAKS